MSTLTASTPGPAPSAPAGPPKQSRRLKARTSLLAHGQPMVWLTGGALALALFMIIGLLILIFAQGLLTFWPVSVVQLRTYAGSLYMGEVTRSESYRPENSVIDALPPEPRTQAYAFLAGREGLSDRQLLRTGNFELSGTHHTWVSDFEIADESRPEWALVIERLTNDGRFYGVPKAFLLDGQAVATDAASAWAKFNEYHHDVLKRVRQREGLRKDEVGAVSRRENAARLAVREAELEHGKNSPEVAAAEQHYREIQQQSEADYARINQTVAELDKENDRYRLVLTTADGKEKVLPLNQVARAYPANQLGFWDKLSVFVSRWWEFLTDDPRNVNQDGGVFPAIWGTAAMTLLMSLAVVPFGVLAALYLREYAKAGPVISMVRIAVNNLAGVPSIVFGVFGVGFFCYLIGGNIDSVFFTAQLADNEPTYGKPGLIWASLTLALLTLPVVIVATEEALSAVPNSMREGSYACGASKWQTVRRIVLPRAMPGILTGMILAMARGAGEVAPLMLVGAVKWTSKLPVDNVFPYAHPERSFMHLGFHIFDVGFQSPNSEAAKPMVFTTTLLLIGLIFLLNVLAVWLRNRLRKRFVGGQF